jgi:ketosteroid isomerase-like protein
MSKNDYAAFRALDPFFAVVMEGLSKFVDGEHYFDTLDDDVLFEFRYDFPGWPQVTRGRADLVALYAGYGNSIRLDRGDALITHPSENGGVVTLEYEVHGKILATDMPYDNRFVSIATIENRKIVRWPGLHGFARRMEGVERGHLTGTSRFKCLRRQVSTPLTSTVGSVSTKCSDRFRACFDLNSDISLRHIK